MSPSPVLSPDGSRVLVAEQGNRALRVENLNDRGTQSWELPNLPGGTPPITALALAPSGNQVLVGCQDGTVRLWKKQPGGTAEAHTSRKAQYSIKSLAFSADGRRASALTGTYGPESLMVWDVENWRDFRFPPHDPRDGPTCAAFSPDGQRLLSGTLSGSIYLWDLTTGKHVRTYRQHRSVLLNLGGSVQQVAFTPDGGSALSWAVNDPQPRLWRLH
jgi:WD40 repeat protein